MVLEAQEKSTGAKQKDGTIGGWKDLRVKSEGDCEKGEYRWRDMGPAEIMLRYLKERTANDILPEPTIYALCQAYYERTEGRMHCKVPGICGIMSCVLCYSEKLDSEQDTVAKGQVGEEGKEEIVENWGAMVEILESSKITIGKPAWGEEEEIRSREGKDQLDEVFGQTGGYPTSRRPFESRREVDNQSPIGTIDKWYKKSKIRLGVHANGNLLEEAMRILYTWRDLFTSEVSKMPTTDLVCHYIPTWPGSIPVRAREKLYTQEETRWMDTKIPEMLAAGIIEHAVSSWSHRTKFVRKKDKGLRMVHVFCPINAVTINHSYPMKRIEPVINNLTQARYKVFLQADAANGFWAVPLYPRHSYKTAFSTSLGQFQYRRMGQGLSGAPQTYSRLKDFVAGPIPFPLAEPALSRVCDGSFEHFIDDDFAAHVTPAAQLEFMHYWYFPRLHWAKMTLKPSKSGFLLDSIEPLGFRTKGKGLRPSLDKVCAIREYPIPTNQEEIERFLYMTTYLRYFIPGRADHARMLKKAVIYKEEGRQEKEAGRGVEGKLDGSGCDLRKDLEKGDRESEGVGDEQGKESFKGRTKVKGKRMRRVVGFKWGEDQQKSFEHIKSSIISNAVYGGDDRIQYHLATDASKTGMGGVLFQIIDQPAGTIAAQKNRKTQRIIMFISKPFTEAETRYSTTEREALAVVRCLEEVRWLVLGSAFPTKVHQQKGALRQIQ